MRKRANAETEAEKSSDGAPKRRQPRTLEKGDAAMLRPVTERRYPDLNGGSRATNGVRNMLKVLRWQMGIKQYELAAYLECSAPYLSMVENGRTRPTEAFKARAAEIFGLPVDEIFPGT